ncbi:MAG: hypothetical protein H6Q06_2562 [Acidobacteria bacterium]|nr:hypothetical protein [Acidobacteriota bacterium]
MALTVDPREKRVSHHVPTEGVVPDTEKLRCVHGLDLVGQAQSARLASAQCVFAP